MQVFKCALKCVFRNPVFLLVYVVALSFMGVAMASSYGLDEEDAGFERARVDYAIINRDGQAVASGIEELMSTMGERVEVADTRLAMQDAVAKGQTDYILIIPANFGDDYLAASRDGNTLPQMDTIYSFSSTTGAFIDTTISNYLSALRTYAIAKPHANAAELSRLALDATRDHAPVEVVKTTNAQPRTAQYAFYLEFSMYGLFAAIIACCGMLITTLSRTDVRRRNMASPVSYMAYNLQTTMACFVVALVAWAWIFVLGMICFPDSVAATSALGIVLEGCMLLVFALVPLGVAFLVGQLGLSITATNAIGNIVGLVVSFLGGAWIPLSFMPEAVQILTRFLPGYWFTSGIEAASRITTGGWEQLASVFAGMGMLLLFALVFLFAGLLVGRTRMQTASAGGNGMVTGMEAV